jgi:cytochrome c biogenesis protein CcmG/thiol:disulfide interchange protein DsbE
MKKFVLLVAAIALTVAVYYAAHLRFAGPARALNTASPPRAPALTLVDISGNTINTAQYDGSVVLVNFWAAWCTPCAEEIPKLVALQDKYRAQGLRILGISMDDRDSVLREFYQKNKMNYSVVAGTERIAQAYGGILGLPTTFLISRDGYIRAKHPGLADFTKLEQEVVALLRMRQ